MIERSYLFVPGDRPERFAKALASGAHAIILDLEDAVLPERKLAARSAVREWLLHARGTVLVRINAADTPWYEDDCELLLLPGLLGVMVPKAESADPIGTLAARLREQQCLIPLVETVAGYFSAAAIARVPRVARLALGTIDFMADAGIRGEAEELDAIRTHLVLISRMAGIVPPLDGVTLAIDDAAQLERDVQRSRRFGMGGKLCIHPRQVAAVNTAFRPTDRELDWAHRVIEALGGAGHGAVTVDGKLVDRPVEMLARSILADAKA